MRVGSTISCESNIFLMVLVLPFPNGTVLVFAMVRAVMDVPESLDVNAFVDACSARTVPFVVSVPLAGSVKGVPLGNPETADVVAGAVILSIANVLALFPYQSVSPVATVLDQAVSALFRNLPRKSVPEPSAYGMVPLLANVLLAFGRPAFPKPRMIRIRSFFCDAEVSL